MSVNRVSGTVSPNDTMFEGALESYLHAGEVAFNGCMEIIGGRKIERIIDFPCGHGRVMRWLCREWPDAEMFGVEIDRDGLEFVEQTFGAIPVLGHPNLEMEIPGNADLIWSGSLLTHFAEWQWDLFLPMCVEALSDDGTLIFTAHGRSAAKLAKERHPIYGELINTKVLFDEYAATGFSFIPYSKDYPTYGLSLSSPAWIMNKLQALANAKIVAFHEGAWGHQDMIALRKSYTISR